MARHYTIYGAPGSPYTMKMRAVLRYRRLPARFVIASPGDEAIAHVRPPVIPVIRFPDGCWHVDSTPMIERLEADLPADRSLLPVDPASAFLAWLIEDFADEWGTKIMFHYRWHYDADRREFSRLGVFDRLAGEGRERIEKTAEAFAARQVSRMPLVGCTAENRPLLEATFHELIRLLDAHVTERRFLFGSRPSVADFGLYGQLSQLASDPTPAAIMRADAPYARRWVTHMADTSGVDGAWLDADAAGSELLAGLIRLCTEVYLPFLAANETAIAAGEDRFALEIRGMRYEQSVFRYQAKCLERLRERYATLADGARAAVDTALEDATTSSILAGNETE